MHEYCHRCGGELAGDGSSPFCPHCGTPQLYLQDYEAQTSASDGSTTGATPPPRPQQVDWKAAIQSAVVVAVVGGLLSVVAMKVEMVSPLTWMWTITGSLTTLALYQRRRPAAFMNAGVGARIGMLSGLMLVTCLAASAAIAGVVARYGLHSMAGFDAELTQQLHAQIEKAKTTNPDTKLVTGFLYSPEFRVGMMLAGAGLVSGFVLVLSTLGGAVGGFLRMRRKVPVA
jgi:hypothetical protein